MRYVSTTGRRVLLARSLVVLCAIAGLFALATAGLAQAAVPKLVSYGRFPVGEAAVAADVVDQSSGDVYVADFALPGFTAFGHVDEFNAGGERLAPPSPFAEGALDASAAVNPVNGDLYVLEGFNFVTGSAEIATYEPSTGKPVGLNFPVVASNNFAIGTFVQIASDSVGNVYVPVVPQNEVLEYSPTGALLSTFTGGAGSGALSGPTGVAVAPSGNLWVADRGNNRIEELNRQDEQVTEIHSEGVESVALDGPGDVLAIVRNNADSCGSVESPCPHLVQYTLAGVQVADVGAGSFGVKEGGYPSTVAVSEASGRVYVSDGRKGLVWVFGPPTAPIVSSELTSEVTTTEAKLGARVNPGGIQTSYRFEYDTREYKEGEAPHGQSTPIPEGSVGEGVESHAVWAAASGLAPGTTYHYRVVATSELAPEGVVGEDHTFTTPTAAQVACSNEEFRGGFSARLPDCRAYELVIAPAKNSSQPHELGPVAADGEAFAFTTEEPLPGAPSGGSDYVASREAGGWSPEDLIPSESYTGILCSDAQNSNVDAYSENMSKVVLFTGFDTRASKGGILSVYESCNAEGLQVVSGEPVGYENLLVREKATGAYRLVNPPPPGVTPADANFEGASPDLSHVIFTETSPLAEGAQYGVENLYEWDEGALRLLTVLPDGTPAGGSLAAEGHGEGEYVDRPISNNGSHILFTSGGGLYDRIDGKSTVQIDEKRGGSGASGGGVLRTASTDGSRVFFLDESRLTAGSAAGSGEPDLYECVLVLIEGAYKCELSDLTVSKTGESADVLSVSGLGGDDSSHVYFTAKGVLAKGATSGENNLYVYEPDPEHEGQFKTVFIATLLPGEGTDGVVSPDGTWFAFVSSKSLTGYDNSPDKEVFLYSAATGQLACASCDPSGEAPSAGGAGLGANGARPLADEGHVFFETREALVPSDTNGKPDVYEYENGQPLLISSGTSANESTFQGASENGENVFFQTTQRLLPQDTQEEEHVVYDARMYGGFPALASPPSCTTVDACRTPVSPQPSIYGAPSSQTFSGPGNLTPSETVPKVKPKSKPAKCKKGFVKKKGRCVKRSRKKAGKSAHANRRTGK